MGIVVTFPEVRTTARDGMDPQSASATVIILPVVRIERIDDGPSGDMQPTNSPPGRKRRRRASRT
jgi:hypothetical protein